MDADFAELYGCEPAGYPKSVRSRIRYIIMLGNCLLIWRSQLQTEISLSTLEAEYSHSTRTLLPILTLLIELATALELPSQLQSSIHTQVFEDNNGALPLVNNQKIKSRTKYPLVKWHFFWSHKNNGDVTVLKIDSHDKSAAL